VEAKYVRNAFISGVFRSLASKTAYTCVNEIGYIYSISSFSITLILRYLIICSEQINCSLNIIIKKEMSKVKQPQKSFVNPYKEWKQGLSKGKNNSAQVGIYLNY